MLETITTVAQATGAITLIDVAVNSAYGDAMFATAGILLLTLFLSVCVAYAGFANDVMFIPYRESRAIAVLRRIGTVILLFAMLAGGLYWIDAAKKQITADVRAHLSIAETTITESLHSQYDVSNVVPAISSDLDGWVTSFDSVSVKARLEWLEQAVQNNPASPAEARVELADGTFVAWGVVADPVTGEARLLPQYQADVNITVTPDDVLRADKAKQETKQFK